MREVFIRSEGASVILTPRPSDWSAFLASGEQAPPDFMVDFERMPTQERDVTATFYGRGRRRQCVTA